jgi:hypothetical protein
MKTFEFKIPIGIGWIKFHNKEQWLFCDKTLLVCHYFYKRKAK